MASGKKRRGNNEMDSKSVKKNKTKEYWKNQAKAKHHSAHGIEEGSAGIFATCDRGREARCVDEMYGLLEKATREIYGLAGDGDEDGEGGEEGREGEEGKEDIEAAIRKEITGLNRPKAEKPFVSVRLDIECVVFFRLKPPCDPTALVAALCAAAQRDDGGVKSRYVHRLTPVTKTGKATAEGLEGVAKTVLAPHFHDGQGCVKFAIRPTTRNHNQLRRDQVIKIVADAVGPGHKADLKNPDVVILVEIYQNICGMSVVKDWEELKKFNLAQLQGDRKGNADADADRKDKGEAVVGGDTPESSGAN